jgi:hypothetical protein
VKRARSGDKLNWRLVQLAPELKPTAEFTLKLQSLGPVERFGRAVDRFFAFAFFLPAIVTSVLPTHSLGTGWQSQERI